MSYRVKLRVKELLEEEGITQKKLAEMAGVRESTISDIVNTQVRLPPHWRLAISERSLISKKCKTDQRGVYHPFFLSACYNYKNPAQGGKIYTQLRKLLHLQPTSSFERIPPSQRRAQIFHKMQSIGSILDRKALSIRREYLVCRLCRFDIVFGPHLEYEQHLFLALIASVSVFVGLPNLLFLLRTSFFGPSTAMVYWNIQCLFASD